MFVLSNYNKDIGNRIKELRELSDITIADFAEEMGVEKEIYEKYEVGEIDIPASFVNEIANRFGVDLGLLLTGVETRMSIFDVTRADKGVTISRRKEYSYENLCDKFMNKKAEMFIVTVDPEEDSVPSLNTHKGQEFNYILEGSMKLYIHNNEIILNKGDSVIFDASHRHAMSALNGQKAKFLAVIV